MKTSLKVLSGIVVMFVVLGTITLLAVKYFDTLLRIFDHFRDGMSRKKTGLFSDECCDCQDDDIESDDFIEAM